MHCTLLVNTKIHLFNLYRRPYSSANRITEKSFLDDFQKFNSLLVSLEEGFVILGDLNINLLNSKYLYTKKCLNILECFNLKQHITTPTHVKGSLIDFIITDTDISSCVLSTTVISTFNTDHYPLQLLLEFYQDHKKQTVVNKEIRDTNDIEWREFEEDLKKLAITNKEYFSSLSLEDSLSLYNSELSALFNKHCPIKLKRYRPMHDKSRWFNSDLKTFKRKKRKLERLYRKNPSQANKESYHIERNKYNKELKLVRSQYNLSKILDCKSDTKKFYKTIIDYPENQKKKLFHCLKTTHKLQMTWLSSTQTRLMKLDSI